jgi:hypothetical protein
MRLPVTVTPPKNTSKASATTVNRSSAPGEKPVIYSPIPTRVAASAPNAWLSAMRCGIAVISIGVLANVVPSAVLSLQSLSHSGLFQAAKAWRKIFSLKGRNFRLEYTAKMGICGEAHFGSSLMSAPLASPSLQ